MTETEFLTNGHIREYYDIRELEIDTRDWLNRIKSLVRDCEKEHLDYDEWIDKECLRTVFMQLECVLEHKDNPNVKKLE